MTRPASGNNGLVAHRNKILSSVHGSPKGTNVLNCHRGVVILDPAALGNGDPVTPRGVGVDDLIFLHLVSCNLDTCPGRKSGLFVAPRTLPLAGTSLPNCAVPWRETTDFDCHRMERTSLRARNFFMARHVPPNIVLNFRRQCHFPNPPPF
jgi:hypothetical protein